MPTDAKRAAVAELAGALADASNAIVSDYRGLSVADISAVRRSLRGQHITYRVVKNRLARIAADQAGRAEIGKLLDGPSAIAVGGEDEVALAKGVLDALRPFRNISIRGAVIGGSRMDSPGLTRLATLPGRPELLSGIAGGLAAPLAVTAGLFDAPLREVSGLLQALADQRAAAGA